MKNSKTKKLTTVGMLCALAYVAVAVGRVPVVLFLKYDPKDVVVVIGGLIFGPLTSLAMALTVSVVEMFTISSTGLWGCLMNTISSCSFACTAAFFYQRHRTKRGGMTALACGWASQIAIMMLWNWLVAPIYMGYPREAVEALLFTAFLPFNVLKGGLNAGITFLIYKPVVTALRRLQLVEK